jgi:formiminotetrahydrofolate cyclodeaminase
MPPYAARPLIELLDALASSHPSPAGGSASALAGAAGVSLLLMATVLPKTRSGAPAETVSLSAAGERLKPLRETLLALVDKDADAYDALLAAFRAPRSTEEERVRRGEGIGAAMRRATDVPLETLRAARQALGAAVPVAVNGSRAASADVNVAVELLLAAVRGAAGSVDANLAMIKDADYVDRIASERRTLEDGSAEDGERARAALTGSL